MFEIGDRVRLKDSYSDVKENDCGNVAEGHFKFFCDEVTIVEFDNGIKRGVLTSSLTAVTSTDVPKTEAPTNLSRPPFQIMSSRDWHGKRIEDLVNAIGHRCKNSLGIPDEWVAEYNYLVKKETD